MPTSTRRRASTALTAIACLALCSAASGAAPGAEPAAPAGPPAEVASKYGTFTAGPLLREFLEGPMAGLDEIVFAVRVPGRDHWYVTFGNYACDYGDGPARAFKTDDDGVCWGYGEGARLCRLNLRSGELKVILEDPRGGIRDPQMHYDGQKILFSYRKGGTHPFHLYEINIDGTGLTQLTDGPDDDIEPTYCPDGSIVFCSSRCRRFVNCWFTRVATLYRCEGDGSNVRMLSSNNDHDNTPWVLPDGRLLYMRWEYVDRSQVHFHHLWTTNPDGTGQMTYYGNMHGGIAMLDATPIPGTNKVVAAFSPGHGRPEHLGPIAVVRPRNGPDDQGSARTISKGSNWKDPYALSEDCFLVASPRGIHVMNGEGREELIFRLGEGERHLQCHEPRPLRARPRERVIPSRTDLAEATGRVILEDIYEGRSMEGVERGAIKKLLVLEQVPKPVNFSGGMEPLTIGGSFTLARIVGTVPVEPDGSADAELPALRSLFFVALDENDVAVKRMHSFLVLQPGETTSCVGCHEQRVRSPHAMKADLMALRRRPSRVEPIDDVPSVLDFPRDIQPILDKHCVECHSADRFDGKVDLSGDKTARYTMSYWTVQRHGLVVDGRNQPHGNRPPYSYGSATSRLMKLIDGSHYDAKLSPLEVKTVRLWIETSATYPGTYASLGCGDFHPHLPVGDMMARCGGCHGAQNNKVLEWARGTSSRPRQVVNASRPEKSFVLRAPLAKEAGGLALCKEVVFTSTDDPLYQKILADIRPAHERLMAEKRFDMPGFRPNKYYIREMQRFGFLPDDLGPDDPVDPYATDRAYWDSFHWEPRTEVASRGGE